jgi:hypothetical protein
MAQKMLLVAPILNAEPVVRSAGYTPVVKCLVETSTNCNPSASTWPDVFLSLEKEGVEKFQASWHELLEAAQAERDAAAGTQQRCRAGEFGRDRR